MAEWGLGLYTCGAWLGLARGRQGEPPLSAQWLEGRQLSESLIPRIAAFLPPTTWADLAWVAVVAGPGSFTSLRLGVVVARTLGQALDIPVFTQSALYCATQASRTPVQAVTMAAHGGQVYGAIWDSKNNVVPEQLLAPQQWQELAQGYPVVSVDEMPATALVEALVHGSWAQFARGARPDWQSAVPLYLQPFPAPYQSS
ncbi:tRNA (adenosine(37)-N6)-threonylcarbamoyltransferase complex dimerization subunit type 1 TsaB [Anthocerotibacter panamensis]|uniref:tRNA (adenosine(37)-N6)-threonylcarbamoyltransferase complex dimerization subunit type 1 TsaB n=1 Tax=Anthocerotibacter panamensis TaxID=2857077 RepID=UPI001C40288B|nr:tRNA (adenosine(37)-N6)-threonylcarbamoyltransferase complex dimerization subunit type 1 TsaB [Anthocerotibacter panamensis]